jgi:pimeloyl-ACP methyl ester carboxylesterase
MPSWDETMASPSGPAGLSAYVRGAGRPVVFLHAGVADSRMWRAQLEAIGRTHRAIAYDRRGFGATPPADAPYSEIGDLLSVLDEFAPGRAAIAVGCSMGGQVAIDTVLAAPDRICGLVLVAPALSGAPAMGYPAAAAASIAALEAAEAAHDLDRINELEARLWLDGPLAPPGRVGGALRQLFLDMNAIALKAPQPENTHETAPAYGRLGEIAVPTLVIWGDLDFPDIQARCRHLAAEIPGAQAKILPGAAHLPSLERPAELTDLICGFAERVAKPA